MAYDQANAYEIIELYGLTEKGAALPIPEDHILTDNIVRETFEALLGQLRNTGLEAEIEPLAHGLATILQRRKIAIGKELDRTADKIGALAKSQAASVTPPPHSPIAVRSLLLSWKTCATTPMFAPNSRLPSTTSACPRIGRRPSSLHIQKPTA